MDNQRLLVLSDTHGAASAFAAVLNWAKDINPGAVAFLGDGVDDLKRAVNSTGFSCTWHIIRGNNDIIFSIPESAVFDFSGHRFYICHGHRSNNERLAAIAHNNEADAALFGHTHVPFLETLNGVFLLNPGSIGRPRSNAGPTFAVIGCSPCIPLQAEFFNINAGSIKKCLY